MLGCFANASTHACVRIHQLKVPPSGDPGAVFDARRSGGPCETRSKMTTADSPADPRTVVHLHDSVDRLPGVGPERAVLLARLGIRTLEELLLTSPRRYEDRRHFVPIAQLEKGVSAAVSGSVVAAGTVFFRQRTKRVFEIVLDDGTARLHCRWWNLPFMERLFAVGDRVMAFGKCHSLKPRTMDHPETETLEPGEDPAVHLARIVPVYPLTEGLGQRILRSLVWATLERITHELVEPSPNIVPVRPTDAPDASKAPVLDLTVASAASTIQWPSRARAIRDLHFPLTPADADLARKRLALDEFIALQLNIQSRRQTLESRARPIPCGGDNRMIRPFLASLPFRLTESQTQVLREIRADLSGDIPMRRLLQGDVGSGKTVVAACAAIMAIESGWRVALMAPTEILAGQHFASFVRWFSPLNLGVALRTGSEQKAPTAEPVLTIGTHALLQVTAEFERLGLVIIDEQHKFGVAQRETLVRKGHYPHLLVMTATPIPRTLGLTLYGDLDVSTLAHFPVGRGTVRTHVRSPEALPKVWEFVRKELAKGRQAYVVYPRVLESDHDDVKAVTREFERLQGALAPYQVGLLHGQLPSDQKESVMKAFREGTLHVLVATSVIEVGVDVPNATLMVIENAEQFGLAQLHQLRGRIGRGGHDGHCILVSTANNEEAQQRLRILAETRDGFEIAEADLRLRGPGELTGRQQSGLPPFRFGDLIHDRPLIELARELVKHHLRPGRPKPSRADSEI